MTLEEQCQTASNQPPERRKIPEQETERTILALLLCEPQPWTREELARELGGQPIETHDALESLIRCGLVNREGECVAASRAARAFEALEA
jgi:predicted transcriptional regulator